MSCNICLEDFKSTCITETCNKCNTIFDKDCLLEWFIYKGEINCPICRDNNSYNISGTNLIYKNGTINSLLVSTSITGGSLQFSGQGSTNNSILPIHTQNTNINSSSSINTSFNVSRIHCKRCIFIIYYFFIIFILITIPISLIILALSIKI